MSHLPLSLVQAKLDLLYTCFLIILLIASIKFLLHDFELCLRNCRNEFVLGEQPTLQMEVEVTNMGEPAFLARTILSIPTVTPLVRIPPTCEDATDKHTTGTQVLFCDFGNPLEKNVMYFFFICFIRFLSDISVQRGTECCPTLSGE